MTAGASADQPLPSDFPIGIRGHHPVADRLGPFPTRHFLSTVWRHTSTDGQVTRILSDERGEVPIMIEGDHIGLIGDEDLVDYRSPSGEAVDLLVDFLSSADRPRSFRFDSLPAAGADVFSEALDRSKIPYRRVDHGFAAVVDLPDTFNEYLMLIGKKQRHEVRRKRRRFVSEIGSLRVETVRSPGPILEEFFHLHRGSSGRKGSFMTAQMEGLFTDLLAGEGWRLDALYGGDSPLLAAMMSYADQDGYFLYNSAFHPDFRRVSPGMVLLGELIATTIDMGGKVFDFLKGSETYKFRLGARPRPLFLVEGRLDP